LNKRKNGRERSFDKKLNLFGKREKTHLRFLNTVVGVAGKLVGDGKTFLGRNAKKDRYTLLRKKTIFLQTESHLLGDSNTGTQKMGQH